MHELDRYKSGLYERVMKGVTWTFLGNLIWRASSAISTIIVARILGPIGFGEFGLVRSTADMFSVYAGSRMGATSAKYVAEYRLSNPPKAARILKLTLLFSMGSCLLASLALLLSASFFANQTFQNNSLLVPLVLSSFLVFFLVYGNVQEFALTGFENFKAIAKVSMLRGLAVPLLSIPFAFYWGVSGAIFALVLVAVLAMIFLVWTLRQERTAAGFTSEIPLRKLKHELPVLWKFALPGILVGSVLTISAWIGKTILVQYSTGFSELGQFEAANQWRTLVLFLPAVLTRVMLPILSATYVTDQQGDFRNAVSLSFQSSCMVLVPLVILLIGLSDLLISFYGIQFVGAAKLIPILALTVFLFGLNQSLRQVYDGTGKRWTNLLMYLIWGSVFITVSLVLIPEQGATGLATAYLTAELVLFLTQFIFVERILVIGVLSKHLVLLSYSFMLLIGAFYLRVFVDSNLQYLVTAVFLLLGSIPIAISANRILNR